MNTGDILLDCTRQSNSNTLYSSICALYLALYAVYCVFFSGSAFPLSKTPAERKMRVRGTHAKEKSDFYSGKQQKYPKLTTHDTILQAKERCWRRVKKLTSTRLTALWLSGVVKAGGETALFLLYYKKENGFDQKKTWALLITLGKALRTRPSDIQEKDIHGLR